MGALADTYDCLEHFDLFVCVRFVGSEVPELSVSLLSVAIGSRESWRVKNQVQLVPLLYSLAPSRRRRRRVRQFKLKAIVALRQPVGEGVEPVAASAWCGQQQRRLDLVAGAAQLVEAIASPPKIDRLSGAS